MQWNIQLQCVAIALTHPRTASGVLCHAHCDVVMHTGLVHIHTDEHHAKRLTKPANKFELNS